MRHDDEDHGNDDADEGAVMCPYCQAAEDVLCMCVHLFMYVCVVCYKVAQRPAVSQIRGCVVFWLTKLFLIFSRFLSDRTSMSYLSNTHFHESLFSSVAMGIALDRP